MEVIREVCREIVVLAEGAVVEGGTVEEVFSTPRTQAARELVNG
jgi:D-methionine transport system ATP-binding protein